MKQNFCFYVDTIREIWLFNNMFLSMHRFHYGEYVCEELSTHSSVPTCFKSLLSLHQYGYQSSFIIPALFSFFSHNVTKRMFLNSLSKKDTRSIRRGSIPWEILLEKLTVTSSMWICIGFILFYLTDNLLHPLLLIPWSFVEFDFPLNIYFTSVLLASQWCP